ncbi:MAG TPA: SGNH/GDSL hydrolase family protein, partial [Candidatus Saccharimonadales bacterium]|nr:SGNH/GDSL hydrolase family protein [Candidatus Saccharimonadales bacterium]
MNLLMLVLTIGTTELLARVLSKQTRTGETLFGVLLYPKEWSQFATYYRQVVDDLVHDGSYLVHDPILGWTVGASRTDRTGLYSSSAEGLRSPHTGMSFVDLRVRHSRPSESPASFRIALIGDSMTQGHEVRCEESWGHRLEAMLQPHAQILNFAVVGHGLTQTLLRYEKDVRPWKPQIVIIG